MYILNMLAAYIKQRDRENKEIIRKQRENLKKQLRNNIAAANLKEKVDKIKQQIKKNEMMKYEEPFLKLHKTKSTNKRK